MREQFLVPVGSDLVAASLPAGQIRSVMIDNPSGQWLQLFPTYEFIQPYTIGIVRTFPGEIQNVTIRRNAPAGQVGTQAGDPVRIILDSEPLPEASGVPFIQEFTPVGAFDLPVVDVPLSTGLTGTLIVGTLGRRTRLLSISVTLGGFPANPFSTSRAVSPVTWTLIDTITFDNALVGRVTPESPVDPRTFMPGLDFPEFAALQIQASTDWADSRIGVTATAQVI